MFNSEKNSGYRRLWAPPRQQVPDAFRVVTAFSDNKFDLASRQWPPSDLHLERIKLSPADEAVDLPQFIIDTDNIPAAEVRAPPRETS